eukprot:6360717-Karenia_brevis.AAC.1
MGRLGSRTGLQQMSVGRIFAGSKVQMTLAVAKSTFVQLMLNLNGNTNLPSVTFGQSLGQAHCYTRSSPKGLAPGWSLTLFSLVINLGHRL